ncbi:SAM hydroxide adenosyltransferase [Kribbella sp. NPDC056345]|uniref:SAM hydroxide adenosyltransferase n=1 Tax=Kribbella sp. NPDC056345 TaxID=3345789 RepID=UPI0035E15B36
MYPITYLTDCVGGNARARLSTRIGALFGQSPTIIALDGPDPEAFAALTLLDCLRSTESLGGPGHPTITLLNLAPRDGHWPNGVPFCFFWYGEQLVASTITPRALDLVRRELGITEVQVTDIAEVLTALDFDPVESERIITTQFRSLWYLPLLARWVVDGRPVPSTLTAIPEVPDDGPIVSVIDNFGNCKFNCPPEDLTLGTSVRVARRGADGSTEYVEVSRYPHLTAVPRNTAGLIPGSSGTGFAELVIRGGSAAAEFGLQVGDAPIPARQAVGAAC